MKKTLSSIAVFIVIMTVLFATFLDSRNYTSRKKVSISKNSLKDFPVKDTYEIKNVIEALNTCVNKSSSENVTDLGTTQKHSPESSLVIVNAE